MIQANLPMSIQRALAHVLLGAALFAPGSAIAAIPTTLDVATANILDGGGGLIGISADVTTDVPDPEYLVALECRLDGRWVRMYHEPRAWSWDWGDGSPPIVFNDGFDIASLPAGPLRWEVSVRSASRKDAVLSRTVPVAWPGGVAPDPGAGLSCADYARIEDVAERWSAAVDRVAHALFVVREKFKAGQSASSQELQAFSSTSALLQAIVDTGAETAPSGGPAYLPASSDWNGRDATGAIGVELVLGPTGVDDWCYTQVDFYLPSYPAGALHATTYVSLSLTWNPGAGSISFQPRPFPQIRGNCARR